MALQGPQSFGGPYSNVAGPSQGRQLDVKRGGNTHVQDENVFAGFQVPYVTPWVLSPEDACSLFTPQANQRDPERCELWCTTEVGLQDHLQHGHAPGVGCGWGGPGSPVQGRGRIRAVRPLEPIPDGIREQRPRHVTHDGCVERWVSPGGLVVHYC